MRLTLEPLSTECQEMFSVFLRWGESDGEGGFTVRWRKMRREVVMMRFEGER